MSLQNGKKSVLHVRHVKQNINNTIVCFHTSLLISDAFKTSDRIVECRNKMLHLNNICNACLYIYMLVVPLWLKPQNRKKLKSNELLKECLHVNYWIGVNMKPRH